MPFARSVTVNLYWESVGQSVAGRQSHVHDRRSPWPIGALADPVALVRPGQRAAKRPTEESRRLRPPMTPGVWTAATGRRNRQPDRGDR
jgi:hypothetical protein